MWMPWSWRNVLPVDRRRTHNHRQLHKRLVQDTNHTGGVGIRTTGVENPVPATHSRLLAGFGEALIKPPPIMAA